MHIPHCMCGVDCCATTKVNAKEVFPPVQSANYFHISHIRQNTGLNSSVSAILCVENRYISTTKSHVALSRFQTAAFLCSFYMDCTSVVCFGCLQYGILRSTFLLYHLNRPIMYSRKDIGQSSMNHFSVFIFCLFLLLS